MILGSAYGCECTHECILRSLCHTEKKIKICILNQEPTAREIEFGNERYHAIGYHIRYSDVH